MASALTSPTEAFAVASTDSATGESTLKSIGPCETVNCGRGWPQSQMNLRVSKVFRAGPTTIEAIAEVFNLFNAINPSNIAGGASANRTRVHPDVWRTGPYPSTAGQLFGRQPAAGAARRADRHPVHVLRLEVRG